LDAKSPDGYTTEETAEHSYRVDPELKRSINALLNMRTYLLVCSLAVTLHPLRGLAQQNPRASRDSPQPALAERDGQYDFDFEIGIWKTHLWRLQYPLSGSNTWVEYEGTSVVGKVWNGRPNLIELEVDGPAGHIEALNLRLYNPQSHQWSLNFASSSGGTISQRTIGEFKMVAGSFLIRNHLIAEPSLSALSSRIPNLTYAVLNNHSRTIGAKSG